MYANVTLCFMLVLYFEDGGTPLLLASSNGHIDIATMLLEMGADIEAKDDVSISQSCSAVVQCIRSTCSYIV